MKTTTAAVPSPAVIANPNLPAKPAVVAAPPKSEGPRPMLDVSGFDPIDLIILGEG